MNDRVTTWSDVPAQWNEYRECWQDGIDDGLPNARRVMRTAITLLCRTGFLFFWAAVMALATLVYSIACLVWAMRVALIIGARKGWALARLGYAWLVYRLGQVLQAVVGPLVPGPEQQCYRRAVRRGYLRWRRTLLSTLML